MKNTLLFVFLVVVIVPICNAHSQLTYSPTIDVNYEPDWSSDEGGFWYKVNQLEADVKSSPYLIRDKELNNYVSNMVCKIAGEYCSSIRVYIIDNPHFNAAMYPNGMMHVWTGLLLRVENESQLAAILGHEVAHFLRTHQIEQWRQAQSTAAANIILDIGIAAVTGVYGLATLANSGSGAAFSRKHEKEADIMGAELMHKAGFDPLEASLLWGNILEERNSDKSKESRSTFFASHPASEERNKYLKSHALTLPKVKSDDNKGAGLHAVVSVHYERLMKNHIALQEQEQTEVLLERHKEMGYPLSLIHYFYGELSRKRGKEQDIKEAISHYKTALTHAGYPNTTHKHLAYLYLKVKENSTAKAHFEKYLELVPDAKDKAMVAYYIKTLG
ncbi:hypothetical protein N473_07410 [Pseudoalteromonas luteoviolacea CPMOR-1]|uniref:Peptidase M48 domain-containing protein n=1 Tax=Pseudoalteromonas luteoviolacea CPMOR-1 TaxID=1365248 RepID=A0A162CHV2_9GAMM|nr:M48 family metallopeptidase [Pseudoalteromonas luteoviolacea]KZN68244.1 hypothetical protein N473_07410 [Pseudoalteromonas luteoviolacea CPMOR-1]